MTNLNKKLKTLAEVQVDQDGVGREHDLLPQWRIVEDQRDLKVLKPVRNYLLRKPVLAIIANLRRELVRNEKFAEKGLSL
jgi:hypothetical protein